MRSQRFGEHVCAVVVVRAVILRPRLALRIRLHLEAAEVGDQAVDLIYLIPPPRGDRRIARVARFQAAELHRRGEKGREVHPEAVGPEEVGQRSRFVQVFGGQAFGLGVDVVQADAVEADGRAGAGVVVITRVEHVRQVVPLPQRFPGVAALDGAIEVVPVCVDAPANSGPADDVERADILVRLEQSQEVKDAGQDGGFRVARHHNPGVRPGRM